MQKSFPAVRVLVSEDWKLTESELAATRLVQSGSCPCCRARVCNIWLLGHDPEA